LLRKHLFGWNVKNFSSLSAWKKTLLKLGIQTDIVLLIFCNGHNIVHIEGSKAFLGVVHT